MSFGQTLRTAREAKSLTASELASRTHLLVQVIEGLENEDFRRIPAPIYGRGFVKLYCEVVGLDPKPLQAEFMTLYSLNKEAPTTTARPTPPSSPKEIPPAPPAVAASTPPPPQQVSAPEEKPVPEPLPAAEDANPKPEPPPTAEGMVIEPEPPPRRSYGELFEQTYAQEGQEKTSATEKFRNTMSNVSHGVFANVKKLPPNTGRIVMVCIATIILFVLIGWGIAALYKATTPQPSGENKSISQPKQETAAKPLTTTDKTTSSQTPTKQEAGSSLPTKREAGSTKTSLPTKRASASVEGKPTATKSEALRSSGIQIPSLYID